MLTEHPHTMSFIASEHWKPTRKGTIEHDGPAPGTMTAVQLPTNGINAYESGFGIRTAGQDAHTNPPTRQQHTRIRPTFLYLTLLFDP